MTLPFKKTNRGFTLIELLVVISIIGILASVVMASLTTARTKGNDAKRLSEIRELQKSIEAYYLENGRYPNSVGVNTGNFICSRNTTNWQNSALATELSEYFTRLPVDPVNENTGNATAGHLNYCYWTNVPTATRPAGTLYMLVFTLENQNLSLDQRDGAFTCGVNSPSAPTWDYMGNDGYTITYGGKKCP